MKPLHIIPIVVASLLFFPSTSWALTQTFTSNGTFTVPAGITSVSVSLSGGGGGGAGALSGVLGSPTPGGTTSFGSFISAGGGGAGSWGAGGAAGGPGGTAGGPGAWSGNGGNGGSSLFGSGGAGVYNSYSVAHTAGISGSGYGAGGGGSWAYYGGGGGAGSYKDLIFSVVPGQNIPITVGQGGTGHAYFYPAGGNGSGGFVEVSTLSNAVPQATIVIPTGNLSVPQGTPVGFFGSGADSDAGDSIDAYEWREGDCGTGTLLSSASSFSLATPTTGVRTIFFRVQDSRGAWSLCDSRTITTFINASCGPANGIPAATAPTPSPALPPNNLCTSGTAPAVTDGETSFTWSCDGPDGLVATADDISCSAPKIATLSLSLCTAGGIPIASTSGPHSRSLAVGSSEQLHAYYDTTPNVCGDSSPVTNATWTENAGSAVVTLAGPTTSPQTVTAGAAGTERITVSRGLDMIALDYAVNVVCTPTATCAERSAEYCRGQPFTIPDNGCGSPLACEGARYCDFNWKEVAPGN